MNAATIGIIGGADGPTAIFLTSSFSWVWILLGAAAIGLGIFCFVRYRKKRRK